MRYELPIWAHFIWLIYLGFLFTPLLEPTHDGAWFWPTILSLPVFMALYSSVIFKFRRSNPPGAAALPEVLAMALSGFLLAPVNENANIYIVYCVAVAPFVFRGFRRLTLFVTVLMSVYALELAWLGFKPMLFAITILVGLASAGSNYMMLENRLRNLALQRSGEEVHRLARLAERERIGRDLHDLLGHTLSLIAIKSELAAKLVDRDRAAAGREITEVMNVAREALRQVRTAVTGIRSAALEGEMASARAMLDTAGVVLAYERDGAVLPPEVETTFAMIVREAVTNIQRHARAKVAKVEVLLDDGDAGKTVLLRVSDDGCGGITEPGNGLAGIRERVQSLGGTLEIDSPRDKGTLLRVRVPLGAAVMVGASAAGKGVLAAGSAEVVGRTELARLVAGARVPAADAAASSGAPLAAPPVVAETSRAGAEGQSATRVEGSSAGRVEALVRSGARAPGEGSISGVRGSQSESVDSALDAAGASGGVRT